MQTLLIGIVAFAAFMYLVMPGVIRFNQKISAAPVFEPVDLATLPPAAAQYLWACQQALEAEGFQTISYMTWANSIPNVFPYLALLFNRTNNVKATVTALYVVTSEGAKLKTSYVEIGTRYEDGTTILTNNTKTLNSFKPTAKQNNLRLPNIENPHELYAIHLKRMAAINSSTEPLPAPGTEMAVQVGRMVESMEDQVGFGRFYLDRNLNMYRPTWKGAYLMTWGLLPPMKALRESKERAKGQTVLKALEESPLRQRV